MRKLKVAQLKPGMVFDAPVYIDPNNILVQAKQELTQKDIDRLKKWGIEDVETSGQLVQESKAAPVSEFDTKEEPTPVSASFSAEALRLHSEYEQLRKTRNQFRNRLAEYGKTLEQNWKLLNEKKQFDNQSVLKISQSLVEDIFSVPLIIIAARYNYVSSNPIIAHAVHAACYGVHLGKALNFSRPRLQEVCLSLLLMDSGMTRLPMDLYTSKTDLEDHEKNAIRTHPLIGYKMLLNDARVKASLAVVALQHQESFNGKGYPQGLSGGQIDVMARMARIVDTYSAQLEERPYREAKLPYEAMKNLLSLGTEQYDPKLLRAFLGCMGMYPLGSLIELSTGQIGLVVGANAEKPLRPVLRLMRDEKNLPYSGLSFLDLMEYTQVYIVRAISEKESGVDLEQEM
ncbi:MAG TPA: hypothetical protein DEA96_14125 [Leptospiraceae bacterium]|nr:hypothetical protein [Spirochaetaceae bacterium]HBS06100.1 hypothetical protein [Leptospiraceae bacterium]|tara:strand:- start:25347 stop:26549 length:1203 start_codon:yes stop_codon:yes gene_type:complete